MMRGCRLPSLLAAPCLLAACALAPENQDRLRVQRIEQAVLPMAGAALAAGQYETARRLYGRLLEIDSESAEARMGLGEAALASGAAAEAANWYLGALVRAGTPAARQAALLAHGRAALANGDLAAARTSFARLTDAAAAATRANLAWGHNGLGVVHLLSGEPAQAIASLEKAVLIDPGEPRFQGNLERALKVATSYPVPGAAPASAPEPAGEPQARTPAVPKERPTHSEFTEGVESAESGLEGRPPVPETTVAAVEAPTETEGTETAKDLESGLEPEETETVTGPAGAGGNDTPLLIAGAFPVHLADGVYLQVGAFAVPANAGAMLNRVRERTGRPVRIDTFGGLHRVRIGPLPSRDRLPALAKSLGIRDPAFARLDAPALDTGGATLELDGV